MSINIYGLIKECCERNGIPEFAAQIRVEMNNRFTLRIGDAHSGLNRIRLSTKLWARADDAERRNTIIHETAHLIAHKLHGHFIKSHGKEWQAIHWRCGEAPSRCHKLDRTGLARRQKRVGARCPCRIHTISANKAGRIRNGAGYICTKCRGALVLDYSIEVT